MENKTCNHEKNENVPFKTKKNTHVAWKNTYYEVVTNYSIKPCAIYT
jgi:hypothetical protein